MLAWRSFVAGGNGRSRSLRVLKIKYTRTPIAVHRRAEEVKRRARRGGQSARWWRGSSARCTRETARRRGAGGCCRGGQVSRSWAVVAEARSTRRPCSRQRALTARRVAADRTTDDLRPPARPPDRLTAAFALAGCGDTTTEPDAQDTGAAVKDGSSDGPAASTTDDDEQAKPEDPKPEEPKPDKPKPVAGTALAALDKLTVKGRAPKTGYDREQFGGDWASIDGCDMRQRILQRDLDRLIYEAGSDCDISSGILDDRYTASRIIFHRGGASEVDIDHVVALSDAWQKGAQQWSYDKRVQLANDPLNLLASDAAPTAPRATRTPPAGCRRTTRFRCDYVARQIAVKRRYRAWVTGAEKDAMARVLTPCPDTKLPTVRRVRIPASPPPGEHATEPAPSPGSPRAAAVAAARACSRIATRSAPPAARRSYAATASTEPIRTWTATATASPASRREPRRPMRRSQRRTDPHAFTPAGLRSGRARRVAGLEAHSLPRCSMITSTRARAQFISPAAPIPCLPAAGDDGVANEPSALIRSAEHRAP